MLGALLAQHPADGVGDIAFAASVRPDHGGNAGLKRDDCLVAEGFETDHFEGLELHRPPWKEKRYHFKDQIDDSGEKY